MSDDNIEKLGSTHIESADNKSAAAITAVLNVIVIAILPDKTIMSISLCLMPFIGAILYSYIAKFECLLKAEPRKLVIYKKLLKKDISQLKEKHSKTPDSQLKKEIEQTINTKEMELSTASSDYCCGKLDLSHID